MVYHRDPHRATQKRPRYAMVDGRPFLPFRLPDKQPTEPNRPPYRSDIVNALKDFDFSKISHKSVTDLTKLLSKYHQQNHPSIPLGHFGIIDYGFAPQTLAPGSLNPDNAAAPRDASSRDLLKNLYFVKAKYRDVGSPRLALVLGRLTAQHFNPERVSQSHWIVFLDQTRMLWACYAYGIDNQDIKLDSSGNPGPYHASRDTAFGAKKDEGQKVVFLGALKDILFKDKEVLKAEVHDLDWSSSALSEDQILEMKKQDLLLAAPKEEEKDEDTTEDAKMKDLSSKKAKSKKWWDAMKDAKKRKDGFEKDRKNKETGDEENNEEKLYGTREPMDPKHAAKKESLKKEDNGKEENLDTEDSLAKDVDMEDLQIRSAEPDVLPDADSTPEHGSVED